MIRLVYSSTEPERRDLDREAITWVVRLTSGETSPELCEQFRHWRDQSQEHRQALGRARSLWEGLGEALPRTERRASHTKVRRRVWQSVPIAASLLLAVGLASGPLSTWRYDQATRSGEQRSIALPDGSRMIMSGNSAVKLNFRRGMRSIEIARGEVLFDVRHDPRHPFIVSTGSSGYRDVGTVFSVRRHGRDSRVVVASGEVRASDRFTSASVLADQSLAVTDGRLGHVQAVNARSALAWSRGRLIFRDCSLGDILNELAPHYRHHLVLLNGTTSRIRLSTSIELDHVDEWLDALHATNGVRVIRLGSLTLLT